MTLPSSNEGQLVSSADSAEETNDTTGLSLWSFMDPELLRRSGWLFRSGALRTASDARNDQAGTQSPGG